MGGEKITSRLRYWYSGGSPPRGRGKGFFRLPNPDGERITPAWAGKSCRAFSSASTRLDHPRVGGEKINGRPKTAPEVGSPPRGRGKVKKCHCFHTLSRITPAWAGKSTFLVFLDFALRDHPRVGGEKAPRHLLDFARLGSPPRGRGKGSGPAARPCPDRITPAWAGKSIQQIEKQCIFEDHPRTGGEKLGKISAPNIGQGSPPHRRGKA